MWAHGWYFFLFVVVNTLSYYLYNPMHPDTEQPWLYSYLMGNFRIIHDLSKISEGIGYKEYHVFKQDAIDAMCQLTAFAVRADDGVNITTATFDNVPVRIYRSVSTDSESVEEMPRAALVYLHGGGFMVGTPACYDGLLRQLVKDAGIIVFAVDYRLAPQHPSPAAIEDCMRVSRYVFTEAGALGVDVERVGVAGDSAGGTLAASLTLSFRDMDAEPRFAYMAILYPWLQALDLSSPSMQQNERHSIYELTRHGIARFALSYINASLDHLTLVSTNHHIRPVSVAHFGRHIRVSSLPPSHLKKAGYEAPKTDHIGEDLALLDMESAILDPLNFPLMAESLKGLPPTLVATMEFDTVRDDGFWFVKRLKDDGCSVKHYHDPRGWHGVIGMVGALPFNATQRLYDELLAYIQIFS